MELWLNDILNLGTGGALALMMFFIYRRDRKDSEARLIKLLEKDQESREEHTKTFQRLVDRLEDVCRLARNGHGK